MDERIAQLSDWDVMWLAVGAFGNATDEQKAILKPLFGLDSDADSAKAGFRAVVQQALELQPPLLTDADFPQAE